MSRGTATIVLLIALTPICGTAHALSQERITRAKDAYSRAVELEAGGNGAAALSLLWEAAELAPQDADIQNRLGEALQRIGALEAAVDAYRAAVAVRPDFRRASNNLILALVKVGKGPEAVERARALAATAPDDPDRQFTLALAQSEQDVPGAIEGFRRTMALAPRHVLARYNLALVLSRVDRAGEAIEELRRAIDIEPRPELYHALGVIYWHQGDLDRATTAVRAATARDDHYAEAHYTLGAVLKARRDWNGATTALRRAIALRPDLPAAHYTLAQVLQSAGNEKAARAEFDEAEALRKQAAREQEASVWTAVGAAKLGAGDSSGALDCFQRATAVLDTYAPAFYQMGRVLAALSRPDDARAAFARARQLNPSLVPPRDLPSK